MRSSTFFAVPVHRRRVKSRLADSHSSAAHRVRAADIGRDIERLRRTA